MSGYAHTMPTVEQLKAVSKKTTQNTPPSHNTFLAANRIPNPRGFYAGPVGYISAGASEFGVAIRSALVSATWTSSEGLSRSRTRRGLGNNGGASSGNVSASVGTGGGSEITLFAGAGIVPGSVALSEWAETAVKVCGGSVGAFVLSFFLVTPYLRTRVWVSVCGVGVGVGLVGKTLIDLPLTTDTINKPLGVKVSPVSIMWGGRFHL